MDCAWLVSFSGARGITLERDCLGLREQDPESLLERHAVPRVLVVRGEPCGVRRVRRAALAIQLLQVPRVAVDCVAVDWVGVRDDMSVLRAGKERGLPRQRGADAMSD